MRTHMCGNVTINDKQVTLNGWVAKNRRLGGLIFVQLRDKTGIVQVVFDDDSDKAIFELAETLRSEYVIEVSGMIRERSNPNPDIPTGYVEVFATGLKILSTSETPPFYIEENVDTNEELRLKYRYLDLRRPDMQQKIILRHKIAKLARDYFDKNGFLEIETPMLIKSTPEGARDYIVPSRVHEGKFYALPQSPQLYKQLLMVSGFDRYMQIVKCFRDEDLRADRQPEFTQIDLEMSFVDQDMVIALNEEFLRQLFADVLNVEVQTPFLRLPYNEAMERFGSDKPDMRFEMELVDLTDVLKTSEFKVFSGAIEGGGSVRAIVAKGQPMGRKLLDELTEYVKTYRAKGLAWIVVEENGELRSQITKFLSEEEVSGIIGETNAQPGDSILIVADKNDVVFDALGNLRLEVAKRYDLIDENKFNFLWVTEFPLLEFDEENERYAAKHHPFTSPMDEDVDLLDSAPQDARAKAYDIVLNGSEIGGGSIRIFNSELQSKMFEVLGLSKDEANEKFGFLLEAFKYGVPPHGGMAYGLDRLAMLMTNSESIRDVIAFPKVQTAAELMTDAPGTVDDKQLNELGLKL